MCVATQAHHEARGGWSNDDHDKNQGKQVLLIIVTRATLFLYCWLVSGRTYNTSTDNHGCRSDRESPTL